MQIHVPSSGLSYSSLFEWRVAAQWANYTWEQFAELEGEEQSWIVATYRSYKQAESVLALETEREMRRKMKHPKKGSSRGR